MNIFIIPSWYPSSSVPLSGIFTYEQVRAMAEIRPDSNIIVSLWGHDNAYVCARDIISFKFLKIFKWLLLSPPTLFTNKNLTEIHTPCLTWSPRLPDGFNNRLLEINRRNLKKALNLYGQIDIIHAHVSYPGGYIAARLAEEFKIPFVITEHMSPFPFPMYLDNNRPNKRLDYALSHAKKIITVSPSLEKKINSFGYKNTHVIPNLVDDSRFGLGDSHSKRSKIRFFTLCGISDQKGIDILLSAIHYLTPDSQQVEFVIGGDGEKLKEYQLLASKLGISHLVTWLGAVSRDLAPQLFRDSDVFVLPSRHETFGIVYAEALASGKPIIATRCGGPEFIVNELNGLLVDVGDIESLSYALQNMIETHLDYNAQAIRDDFQNRFSKKAVVNNIFDVYEALLNKKD